MRNAAFSVLGMALAVLAGAALAGSPAADTKPVPAKPRKLMAPYPLAQRRKGQSGYVIVQFRLDPKGMPTDLTVLRAEPQDAFEHTVLKTLRKVRFTVPPDWAAANPDRQLEIAYVFSHSRCVSDDILPDMTTVVIITRRVGKVLAPCVERAPASDPVPA